MGKWTIPAAFVLLGAIFLVCAQQCGHTPEALSATDAFLQRWKLPARSEWETVNVGPTKGVWSTVTVALGRPPGRGATLWYKAEREYINHAAIPGLVWPAHVFRSAGSDDRAWELLEFYWGKDAKSQLKLISVSDPGPFTDEWGTTQVVQVSFTTNDGSTLQCRFDENTWQLRRLERKLPLRSPGE